MIKLTKKQVKLLDKERKIHKDFVRDQDKRLAKICKTLGLPENDNAIFDYVVNDSNWVIETVD